MKPTLLILAAGMGSRYGSLKQMDGIGPNNEAILDYSIYDAIRAGFGKVVFVIRHSFEEDFKQVFTAERFNNKIEVEFVFQELENLPEGFSIPEGREKPWGTNHAVMMGAKVINTPFAVINADDFYGYEAYKSLADYLKTLEGVKNKYCMVGYKLGNTLSEYGTVSRGACTSDESDHLKTIVECYEIGTYDGEVKHKIGGELLPIASDTIVSMNMFGFTTDYFDYSDQMFAQFLTERGAEMKSEYLIPTVTNTLITDGKIDMKVLYCDAKWFGVTFKEDKPTVIKQLQAQIDKGLYPANLWEK